MILNKLSTCYVKALKDQLRKGNTDQGLFSFSTHLYCTLTAERHVAKALYADVTTPGYKLTIKWWFVMLMGIFSNLMCV